MKENERKPALTYETIQWHVEFLICNGSAWKLLPKPYPERSLWPAVGWWVRYCLVIPKFVSAIELVGPKHRTLCTILSNIAYSLGLILLAGVVYLVRDWRQLALATTLPFLCFFLYLWPMPESPRWLLARGQFEKAEVILRNMARSDLNFTIYFASSELYFHERKFAE